jgi:hypothetical protein
MTIRKPNRVTTPTRAALNGTRTSPRLDARARSRWRPGFTRNRASAPGWDELARPLEDDNRQEAT